MDVGLEAACCRPPRGAAPLESARAVVGRRQHEVGILHERVVRTHHASVACHRFRHGLPAVTERVKRPVRAQPRLVAGQPRLVAGQAVLVVVGDLRLRTGDRPHAHVRDPALECIVVLGRTRHGLAERGAAERDVPVNDADGGRRVAALQHAVHVDGSLVFRRVVKHARHMVPSAGLE